MQKKMYKEDILDIMIYNIFDKLNFNESEENKKEVFSLIRNQFNVKDDIVAILYQRYVWLKNMNINPNIIHLRENHCVVMDIFNKCNKMFNENAIEYYYTSGILSYLFVNKDLERYHHDLDIFVNMKDIHKLESICFENGFSLEKKIGDRDSHSKRVMLKLYSQEHREIPITIFMYVRQKDGSIIQNDYFIEDNGKLRLEKMFNSAEIVNLSFSDIPLYYKGIKYFAITPEALYLSKENGRKKDMYDCHIFDCCVDGEKLKLLKTAICNNGKNEVIDAILDPYYEFIYSDFNSKMRILKNDRL